MILPGSKSAAAEKLLNSDAWSVVYCTRTCADMTGPIDWANTHKCHDWRNYVPQAVRDVWDELTVEARLAVCLTAMPMADREDWE